VRDIALAVFLFGLLPFALVRPHWAILLWTWSGLMIPQSLTYGFMRGFPVAMVIGIVALLSVLFSSEKKSLPASAPVMVLLTFLLWASFTTLFALFPERSWSYWEGVMKVMLMIFITIMVMQSKERVTALVWVSTLSIAFFGVKGGIYTIIRGGEGMVLGPGSGIHAHRNSIATALVMTLPLMYWLVLQSQRKWVRIGLIVSMILVAISVLGTFSRGGFLALGAMGVWLWLKSRNKLPIAILLLLLVPPMLQFMPERWHTRMDTIETHQDNSSLQRLHSWYTAWQVAKDRPLTGAGFDCFTPELFARWGDPAKFGQHPGHWHDSHSIWFRVLAEHGFPGIALYLLFWFVSWRTGSDIIRRARDRPELRWAADLAAMCQVSLIGFWVGGSFINLQYWDYPYIIVAVLVLTQVVVRRELEQPSRDEVADARAEVGVASHQSMSPRAGG
jgi:probable O-glycosylation ligase (exosortase A-associated)